MQAVFVVNGAVEKSIVQQTMGKSSNVQLKERSSSAEHGEHVFTVQNSRAAARD